MARGLGTESTALEKRDGDVAGFLLSLCPSALGFSTGANEGNRGDWPALIAAARTFSTAAIELSALGYDELPGLAAHIAADGVPDGFGHVSVHGPAKRVPDDISPVVALLENLARSVGSLVMHPDVMGDPAAYVSLGPALVIENMDARKPVGAYVSDLERIFTLVPEAGFCLDLAHVKTLDPSFALAGELIASFRSRLRELHISGIDGGCHHVPMSLDDARAYAPWLSQLQDVPWIVEGPLL